MTAPHTASPPLAGRPARAEAARRPGAAVLAVALAGTMAVTVLGAAPAAGAPAAGAPSAGAPSAAAVELQRVIVTASGAGAAGVTAAAQAVVAAGGSVLDRLPLVGGVSAQLPVGAVLAPGLQVAPDRPMTVASGDVPSDGAPASTVRATLGMDETLDEGDGVLVAVVDTGVADHQDLQGRLTHVDVSGAGEGDGYGHGTFVAGLVAGDGAASQGAYAGVAPRAHVLDVRVADDDGVTNLATVLRGLQVAHAARADVINLSLSSYSPLPWQLDPLTVALGQLWSMGTIVVVPAGNDGPDQGTVTSPGVHPALLTVGGLDENRTATRTDDSVADFSARGPAPQGVAKPEIVAPGRSVVSLQAPGSVVAREHHATAAVGDHYFKASGTSFSTAVVSGAAAALLGTRDVTPDQLKVMVASSAYQVLGTGSGAGALNLGAVLEMTPPAVDSPEVAHGRRLGQVFHESDIAGTPGDWQPLVRALVNGDEKGAARSWARLPQAAKDWVASSWSSLPADLRAELEAEWTGRNWADGTAEEWAGRNWAARYWAASSWSGRNWAGRNWAGRNWADSSESWLAAWDGRNWAEQQWAGRNWAGRNWAGRNWAHDWAGRNWAGRNWAHDWAGRNWASGAWAANGWGR